MNRSVLLAAIYVASFGTTAVHAQSRASSAASRGSSLISVAEFDALRAQPNVVVLQVGTAEGFAAGHVPGSRPVALSEISTPRVQGALILELPETAQLETWARAAGISDDSRVVVVPSTDELQSSTRVVMTLTFMGLGDRVKLLNGGLRAWSAAGKMIDTGAAAGMAPSRAPLTVLRDSSIIATIADVDAAIASKAPRVVDARLPEFYAGQGGGYPRPGHIPTAVNIPISTVSESGMFKTNEQLRSLFDNAAVKRDEKVVTYCHIGQQATLLWFVARELGYDAKVFDGSFQQWSGSDRPLVAPKP